MPRPPDTDQPALFDLATQDLRQVAVFRSGLSRPADFQGYARLGVPIGIQIMDTSARMRAMAAEYVAQGGLLFVDSGAYPLFQKNRQRVRRGQAPAAELDFQEVLARYGQLIKATPPACRQRLRLVMPDRIGDQAGTLALLDRWRDTIQAIIRSGAEALVAIQGGPDARLSPADAYRCTVAILGTDRFRVAIPSKEAAMTLEQVTDFLSEARPARVHLLGIGAQRERLRSLLRAAWRYMPRGGSITSDANRLRALIGAGRRYTRAREAAVLNEMIEAWAGESGLADCRDWDDTENDLTQLSDDELREYARCLDGWVSAPDLIRAVREGDDAWSELLDQVPYQMWGIADQRFFLRELFEERLTRDGRSELRARVIEQTERERLTDELNYC